MRCWVATIMYKSDCMTPEVLVYDFDYLPDEADVIQDYIKREFPNGIEESYRQMLMECEVYIEESDIITS